MIERYKPNGTPLTPVEDEILTILIEECAEVIQAATKLQRFGKENRPVAAGNLDPAISNSEHLGLEIGDLRYMLDLSARYGLHDLHAVECGVKRKRERLDIYAQHIPESGS